MDLRTISRALAKDAGELPLPGGVAFAYNPLVYARKSHERYLEFGRPGVRVLLLGMNPGPFGMAQTGVPFGEVASVRDWLAIEAPVGKPPFEHPKRPVLGFACARSEVSGRRFWGWAKRRFHDPEAFFERFFVWNYCPLAYMDEGGRNITPDKLPPDDRAEIYAVCDRALRRLVNHLRPQSVIGVGVFGETRARQALSGASVEFGSILHPSPASPLANKGWEKTIEAQLRGLGVGLE